MHYLDLQVIERALKWANKGLTVWLWLAPQGPGAMLVACQTGEYVGSMSGDCVEEDFIARLRNGEFEKSVQQVRYGGDYSSANTLLPCGGSLVVLVECLAPNTETLTHLEVMHATLLGRQPLNRRIKLNGSGKRLNPATVTDPAVSFDTASVNIRIGPALRLINAIN